MITLICRQCKESFQVTPYRAKNALYCSLKCRNLAYVGTNHNQNRTVTLVALTCEYCGKTFQCEPHRLKHGRGKYCSKVCQYAARKDSPRTNAVDCICLNCGKTFQFSKTTVGKRGMGKYCSRKCRDEHRIGSNNPHYINGGNEKRGPNWQSQRRKALKRDNETCQRCGNSGNEVHHITPFRLFGLEQYKEANALSNLITLCDSCHRIVEAEYQRQERQLQPLQ